MSPFTPRDVHDSRRPAMRWNAAPLVTIILALAVAPAAEAVTVKDIIALVRGGVTDEVVLALIESEAPIFSLDAPQILELKRSGVSERVVVAMLRSGREPNAASPPAATQAPPPIAQPADTTPTLLIIGEQPRPEPRREVVVVPYLVMPGIWPPPIISQPAQPYRGFGRFINDGWIGGGVETDTALVPAWGSLRRGPG